MMIPCSITWDVKNRERGSFFRERLFFGKKGGLLEEDFVAEDLYIDRGTGILVNYFCIYSLITRVVLTIFFYLI